MGKLSKILIGLLGLFAVVLVAAAVWLKVVFDPNDYKDQIAAAVEDATGRQLQIHDPISLELFPPLSLSLGQVTFSNADGFDEAPMAEVGHAAVQVKVFALLSKRIEVGVIRLQGLKLWLGQNADGTTNWDDLSGEELAEEEPEEPAEAPAFSVDQLAIGGVEISDAELTWVDLVSGQRVVVSPFDLSIGEISGNQPFEIKGLIGLVVEQPQAMLEIAYQGIATLDLEAQQYALEDLTLNLSATGEAVPNGQQQAELHANLVADLVTQVAKLSDLTLKASGVSAVGEMTFDQIIDSPNYYGALEIESFSPSELVAAMGLAKIETADAAVLSAAAGQLLINGDQNNIAFDIKSLTLDDTTLSGTASINDFAKPFYGFDLVIDQFDADRYMPPVVEAPADEAEASSTEDLNATVIPTEWAKTLGVEGLLKVGKLKVNGMQLSDAVVELSAIDGLVQLKRLAANGYSGTVQMAAAFDVREATAKYYSHALFSGIQAGDLQQDVLGETYVSGAASIQVKLGSTGTTVGQIRQRLSGAGNMKFADGAIHGFNVALSVRKARAALKGEKQDAVEATRQTDFAQLTATFTIEKGVLNNPDLLVMSPAMRMDGHGTADLYNETIDYHAAPALVATSKGQGGAGRDDLAGVAIPIHCTGAMADPKCKLDFSSALKAELGEKADALKDDLRQRLADKLGGTSAPEDGDGSEAKPSIEDQLKDKFRGGW